MRNLIYLLGCLILAGSSYANNSLPELGDPTLRDFSSEAEAKSGEFFYRTLRANLPFIDDVQVNHYVSALGQKLTSHAEGSSRNNYKFFVIASDTINAFAGPDAHIGINSGLILRANNESELAGVMAHEIAHVTQRHLARRIDDQGSNTALTLGAILAAILVGSQSPDAAQAIFTTGIASSYQSAINYTRQNEYEADRIGIGILQDAGISAQGMVGFFEILLQESQGLQIEYLRTHPLNTNRVSEAQSRVRESGGNGRTDSLDFQFTRARLAVIGARDPSRLLLAESALDTPALRYRQALVHTELANNSKAISILQDLRKQLQHPWISLALADAMQQAENDSEAGRLLRKLHQSFPGYLPVTLAYADFNLRTGDNMRQTITMLKHQLQTHNKAGIHKKLAKAYFQNGQIAAALESTGDQYLLEGYRELALQQYENASSHEDASKSAVQRLQKKIELLKEN